jgi:hypothetical protein
MGKANKIKIKEGKNFEVKRSLCKPSNNWKGVILTLILLMWRI